MPSTSVQISMALGMQGAADEGAGKVGTAAAQGGGDAGVVGADEAAHHRHLAVVDQRPHLLPPRAFQSIASMGNRLSGTDESVRITSRASTWAASMPRSREGRGDHAARQALAVADDEVGDARRQLENGGQAAQHLIELIELLVDPVDQHSRFFLVLDQGGGGVAMARHAGAS